MDSITIFHSWLLAKKKNTRDPLSDVGARSYSAIWTSWCRWLTEPDSSLGTRSRASSYLDASPEDLASYLLSGPTPRSSRRSKRALSEVTRRRYWRVIHSVYDHALIHSLITENPANGLVGDDKPPPEQTVGQVFNPRQMAAITSAIPRGEGVWDVRDRAMLTLLIDEAITVSELCSLDVNHFGQSLINPERHTLLISGKRMAQERIIDLSERSGRCIANWLVFRDSMNSNLSGDALFLTERTRRVSPRVVFHLVSTTVSRGFSNHSLDLPMHIGPQVLRNTCIVNWINSGKYLNGVLAKVGLKDAKSLRGLLSHITIDLPKSIA